MIQDVSKQPAKALATVGTHSCFLLDQVDIRPPSPKATADQKKNHLGDFSSGDYSEVVTPVPIPNTVVKHFSADDTTTRWESRSLPVLCP